MQRTGSPPGIRVCVCEHKNVQFRDVREGDFEVATTTKENICKG